MKTATLEAELTMRLSDGRQMGYAEFGDRLGKPVFYNHSGSRLDLQTYSPLAAASGVRLIALDRPGIGLSDFRPDYEILDWPDDVAEAAAQLGLERFAMLGHSSGTVFTLACAYKMPGQLIRCALVGAAAPSDAPGVAEGMHLANRTLFSLARRTSWPLRAQAALTARLVTGFSEQRISQQALKAMNKPDRDAMLSHPELINDLIITAGRETFRSGTEGAVRGNLLIANPWGFRPEEIKVPVFIWQGREDTNTPVAMAEYLTQAIPECTLRIMANEGHMSSLINHMEEILTTLAAPL